MSPVERALLRFLGLYAVVVGVELLERVAYRAGVVDGAGEVVKLADELREVWPDVDEDLADDELEPFDASDVVWLHVGPMVAT